MSKFADNVVRIPCSLDSQFFTYWFKFLQPFHDLTDRETDVAAALLEQRHKLSKVIRDDNILDRVVLGDDTKRQVRESLHMTLPHFQVIMGKLRSSKIIIDGKLNKRFIPKLAEDSKTFKLMLLFEFPDEV